jgi:ribosomal protein RSM22 (predicted rRNA methylase)
MLNLSYPPALETWWMNRAAARTGKPAGPGVVRTIEPLVAALSNTFTVARADATAAYASDAKAWLAYGLYFFPQTFMRVRFVLEELRLRGFPIPPAPRVLDLGAGSGAATAALLDAWGLPGETTLLDRSPVGLDVARDLLVDVYRHAPRTTRGDLRELPDGQWDVLLVSYALNESLATAPEAEQTKWIAAAARRLTPNGLLLLCEPLIDSAGPFMDRLRTAALGEAGLHIWAPCPHAQACPLAARRSSCHDVRNWRMPPAAQALNNRLGRNIQDLKFSFLALSPLAPPAAGPAFRLVAPVHPTKGKWEMLGCAPEGELRRYEVLKRDADEAARRQLGDLERGDRVQLDDLTRAGDAWRGRLSAATPAPSP